MHEIEQLLRELLDPASARSIELKAGLHEMPPEHGANALHARRRLLLTRALEARPWIASRTGIYCGGTVGGCTAPEIAGYMVTMANAAQSPEPALQHLEALERAERVSVQAVLVVSGVWCDARIRLTESIEMVPFDQLSDCNSKQRFADLVDRARRRGGGGPINLSLNIAGLVKHAELSNFRAPLSPPDARREDQLLFDDLEGVQRILGLFDESTPAEALRWLVYDDPHIQLYAVMGGPQQFPPPDLNAGYLTKRIRDGMAVATAARGFLRLPKEGADGITQERMTLALDRLIRSNKHDYRELENKAIDLAIAFEVLLIANESNQELSYRIALRAARVLRKSLQERQLVRLAITALYNARSHAVHTGRLHEKYAMLPAGHDKRKWPASDVVDRTRALFVELALKLLTAESILDWDVVELGESPKTPGDSDTQVRAPVGLP
jgi:hypothetical protein